MQVKGILQYFRPSFSYHLSLRSLFVSILSDRFTRFTVYGNDIERSLVVYAHHLDP